MCVRERPEHGLDEHFFSFVSQRRSKRHGKAEEDGFWCMLCAAELFCVHVFRVRCTTNYSLHSIKKTQRKRTGKKKRKVCERERARKGEREKLMLDAELTAVVAAAAPATPASDQCTKPPALRWVKAKRKTFASSILQQRPTSPRCVCVCVRRVSLVPLHQVK